ncbi:MAG: thiamine-phosphate kinase [Pyrinomonadaceae bacterium]
MRDEKEHNSSVSPDISSISPRSEFEFIKEIRRLTNNFKSPVNPNSDSSTTPHPSSLCMGIGDDAAVIRNRSGIDTVVTTDLLVEGVDFHRAATPARLLGQKALAVSLSDIAAMGARPKWALLSLGLPSDVWDSDFIDQFYEGFFALANHYHVTLAGGDVSRTPERIVIDSIVLGEARSGQAISRSGAQAGDLIFVTGALGGAAAGLRLLESGARPHSPDTLEDTHEAEADLVNALLLRQLCPEPRVGWGAVLGEERLATAMIDISDGFSSDLGHLCRESGVGALIESANLPLDPHVIDLCGRRALDPLLLALHGGEDFELLFTVNPQHLSRLPKRVDGTPATHVGKITSDHGHVRIAEGIHVWDLEPGGFDHFK